MEEEYVPQNLNQYEVKKSKPTIELQKFVQSIENTLGYVDEDQIDSFIQMVQGLDMSSDQDDQQVNGRLNNTNGIGTINKQSLRIPIFDVSKVNQYENLLLKIDHNLDEPKYSFENTEKYQEEGLSSIQAQQKLLLKRAETWKEQQRQKFLKYQMDDNREELLQLDNEINEQFQYSFQYVQGGRQKEIQVKKYDLNKLNHPQYLNDTLINFYLKVLENQIIPEETRKRVYVFNTYFMDKLCPYDKVSVISSTDFNKLSELFSKTYEQIKKWVKEDLFGFDYLLFPLNLPEHWSLIIVSHPNRIFDQDKPSDSCVLYLDSFGIIDQRLITIIKMYLHKNHQEKTNTSTPYLESPISKMPAYQPLVPRQVNYIDCGAFLLEYAESFLNNPEFLTKTVQDPTALLKLEWFPRALVNKKRYLIKQLIVNLSKMSKEEAIEIYKKNRQEIIDKYSLNEDEYDQVENDHFEEFLQLKGLQIQTPEQRHQLMLDYYMNPTYNYYHNESNMQSK